MILLCIFAFLAGFVDAIVGGGGLIQLPAGIMPVSYTHLDVYKRQGLFIADAFKKRKAYQ